MIVSGKQKSVQKAIQVCKKSFVSYLSMKLSLALFLLVALIVILLPDDSEASPLRRQRARRVQALRRARNFRGQHRGPFARRGRTGMGADAPPPPPEGADDAAAGGEDGEGGEEVPDWCNPTTEMGAWLNYKQIRVICGERGATDFGPYGGIPAEEGEGEEGAEEAEEA